LIEWLQRMFDTGPTTGTVRLIGIGGMCFGAVTNNAAIIMGFLGLLTLPTVVGKK
jgi:hypothetical protein